MYIFALQKLKDETAVCTPKEQIVHVFLNSVGSVSNNFLRSSVNKKETPYIIEK